MPHDLRRPNDCCCAGRPAEIDPQLSFEFPRSGPTAQPPVCAVRVREAAVRGLARPAIRSRSSPSAIWLAATGNALRSFPPREHHPRKGRKEQAATFFRSRDHGIPATSLGSKFNRQGGSKFGRLGQARPSAAASSATPAPRRGCTARSARPGSRRTSKSTSSARRSPSTSTSSGARPELDAATGAGR